MYSSRGGTYFSNNNFFVIQNNASEKDEKDFMLEASIIGQFNHINIVKMIGVLTKCKPENYHIVSKLSNSIHSYPFISATPRMIVLEFLSNGSLDEYLKVILRKQ